MACLDRRDLERVVVVRQLVERFELVGFVVVRELVERFELVGFVVVRQFVERRRVDRQRLVDGEMGMNPRRAVVRAGRLIRNVVRDLRFGGILAGQQPSSGEHLGARPVVNSDYAALDLVFPGRLSPDDVLVDVGCGRGRVINWWLANGHRSSRIYGLEYDAEVAAATARRLARFPNVEIVQGDALEHLPPDATLMYLYNPFVRPVVERFADVVAATYAGRRMRLIYSNCKHVDVFRDDPRWDVELVSLSGGAVPLDDVAVIDLVTR